jgi:hypothetical protein
MFLTRKQLRISRSIDDDDDDATGLRPCVQFTTLIGAFETRVVAASC